MRLASAKYFFFSHWAKANFVWNIWVAPFCWPTYINTLKPVYAAAFLLHGKAGRSLALDTDWFCHGLDAFSLSYRARCAFRIKSCILS